MLSNLEVRLYPHLEDGVGTNVAAKIRAALNLPVTGAKQVSIFTIEGLEESDLQPTLDRAALHDPVLQQASFSPFEAPKVQAGSLKPPFAPA